MKVTSRRYATVQIELTEEEAVWLKNYMQNACGNINEEDEETARMRYGLFNNLNRELKGGEKG